MFIIIFSLPFQKWYALQQTQLNKEKNNKV